MLKILKVRDYMSTSLVCVSPQTSLAIAVETLLLHKISGVPVVNQEGELVGMLSEGDCLKGILTGSYFEEASSNDVASVMTSEVETINADADVLEAAERFIKRRRRRLPVIDDGRLVGQISQQDVLRAVKFFNDHSK